MPSDPTARGHGCTRDTIYASYGWWLHKSEDGETFTASAFAADTQVLRKSRHANITDLNGNGDVHGRCRRQVRLAQRHRWNERRRPLHREATLEADFNTNDNYGLGHHRQLHGCGRSVAGLGSRVDGVRRRRSPTGIIVGTDGTDDSHGDEVDHRRNGRCRLRCSGQGSLQDNGDDGVPKVATGTFYSEYSTAGTMVGAFGANKQ